MKLSWISSSIILFVVLCGIFCVFSIGCKESSNPTNPTSAWSSTCNCSANLYNCDSFLSPADAQLCYNHCISLGVGDIHDLDRDNDTAACEDWWE